MLDPSRARPGLQSAPGTRTREYSCSPRGHARGRSLVTFDINSAVARAVSFSLSANLCSDLRVPPFSNLRAPRSPSTDLSSVSGRLDLRAQTSLPSLRAPRSPSADVSSESQAAAISERRRLFRVSGRHDHRGRDHPSVDLSSESQGAAISERRRLFRVSGRRDLRAQTSLPSLRPPRSPRQRSPERRPLSGRCDLERRPLFRVSGRR